MTEQRDEHCFLDCAGHWWRIAKIHGEFPAWIIARCHDKPAVWGRINFDGRNLTLGTTWSER